MKTITFLMNADSNNESDVLAIILHVTLEGLHRLEALRDRAADFTRRWSDGSVNSVAFELPDKVMIWGLDSGLEDESFLEIAGRQIPFSLQDIVLSEEDAYAVAHNRPSAARLVIAAEPLTADNVCEIEANHAPEWTLCRFMVVFTNHNPCFSASFENVDGREFTADVDLMKLAGLIGN